MVFQDFRIALRHSKRDIQSCSRFLTDGFAVAARFEADDGNPVARLLPSCSKFNRHIESQ